MSNFPRRAFVTSDGVQLSYIRQGSGRPIVLIHGWSQCAEEFKHQIEPLSARYDVIAVDQRSHGESQKVSYGLKISRLSKDLYDLLAELDLNEVALLGHSMGAAVIWCYIDLFGPERLSKDYFSRSGAIYHFEPALDTRGIRRFGRWPYRSASMRHRCRLTGRESRTGNPTDDRWDADESRNGFSLLSDLKQLTNDTSFSLPIFCPNTNCGEPFLIGSRSNCILRLHIAKPIGTTI
jgi:pimeloyl-ACP methyl ester carboxylesterase